MQVTFWGTRGSIGIASPQTMRYGGNTSCVEIRTNAGTLLVLDCGTGSYPLGQAIVANPAAYPSNGHLLISHTHWDHIQGIPFFAPPVCQNASVDALCAAGSVSVTARYACRADELHLQPYFIE